MALIWNNVEIPCEAKVVDWRESRLEFTPDSPGCGKRKRAPELFIVHYTGGENPPPRMFENMRAGSAPTAVEFAMDYEGKIWQFCDPAKVFTAHAAGANVFSFGIEIQSRGTPKSEPNKKFPRGIYTEQMEWGRQRYCFFTDKQLTALFDLIDALVVVKVLPKRLAMHKKDIRKRIPRGQWPTCRGVGGHYHFDVQDSTAKVDPGPHVFDELWEHFTNEI